MVGVNTSPGREEIFCLYSGTLCQMQTAEYNENISNVIVINFESLIHLPSFFL